MSAYSRVLGPCARDLDGERDVDVGLGAALVPHRASLGGGAHQVPDRVTLVRGCVHRVAHGRQVQLQRTSRDTDVILILKFDLQSRRFLSDTWRSFLPFSALC